MIKRIKASKKKDPIMAAAGAWKGMKETGDEYQKRVRKGWSTRLKRIYGNEDCSL